MKLLKSLTLLRHLWLLSLMLLILPAIGAGQFVPLAWQSEEPVPWSRDQNRNRVDDIIEGLAPDSLIDIIIDLNRCLSEDEIFERFGQLGADIQIGRNIPYLILKKIPAEQAAAIPSVYPEVVSIVEIAMDGEFHNDVATQATKVRSSSLYAGANVEDAFPGIDGSGVNIAIFDSGVDDGHESFPNYVAGYDAELDMVINPDDALGHGTHVAGTALGTGGTSGTYRGVAPGAGLVDVKVGTSAPSSSAAFRGLEWIIDNRNVHNIQVVNMSFGLAPGNSDGLDAFSQLVNLAVSQGIVMVASAGNGGPSNTGLSTPAAASRAITVANVDDQGTVNRSDDVIRPSSSQGPRANDLDFDPFDELKPEIAAPGTSIMSAQGNTTSGYVNLTGTSMASPHIAGIVALVIQNNPGIAPGSIKEILIQTAQDIDPSADQPGTHPTWNQDWGYGYVDAFAALNVTPTADVYFECNRNSPSTVCTNYLSPDLSTQTTPITEGIPNMFRAEVRNDGPNSAFNVRVDFGVNIYSATGFDFFDIGNQVIPVIPPGGAVVVSQPWIPMGSPDDISHACMKADISYAFDSDFSNNSAQRNVQITQTASPAVIAFQVENPLEEAADIILNIEETDVPEGWEFTIEPRTFFLEPHQCNELAEVILIPPDGEEAGTIGAINVTAIAQTVSGRTIPLTGLQAQAIVALPGRLGDVNGDRAADGQDVSIIQEREVGLQIPLKYPIKCGDVNGDGKVNATDALLISSFERGIPVPYPILEAPCSN